MSLLCRSGYIVTDTKEVRKELTVRPVVVGDFGFPPPPFKVFKLSKSGLCTPRFWAEEKFGPAETDKRVEPTPVKFTFTGKLRDETFQNEALKKGIEAGHGVLSLPCGFGKTTVSLAIAAKLGLRTMIIVHKEFLASQWAERIQQFCPGATIGRVQQDRVEVNCDFVITMLQSLASKEYEVNQFESIGTVLVDEAHHICARVFSQALFKICPKHIFGLSATPDRKVGLTKVLNWFIGPIFFAVEREHQKQVDVITLQFDCRMFHEPPPTTRFGKLNLPAMITELCENEVRNAVIVSTIREILETNRQLLVLSDRRLHCEHLFFEFTDEQAGLYMGGMKEKDLAESSKKRVIFATFSQAHEGLDIPSLDTVFLVTPKSDIKQSIGRIMRETTGKKNTPKIYDVVDHWSVMFAMFNKRKKVYREGGFNIVGPPDPQTKAEENPFKGKCHL
jgi:superfamily II DNA or RNA helicase